MTATTRTFGFLTLALATTLGTTSISSAQDHNRSASFYKRVGSSRANASIYGRVYGSLRTSAKRFQTGAYGSISARVMGFGLSLSGSLNGTVSGTSTQVGAETTGAIRLNGRTILSRNYGAIRSKSLNLGPYYPIPGGIRFRTWVGPIPFSVRGNCGIGGRATMTLTYVNPQSMRIIPSLRAEAFGTGYLFAGVDAYVAGFGISADVEFGKLSVGGRSDFQPSRVSGRIYATLTAADLRLYLKAWLGGWIFKKTWTKTLFWYRTRSVSLGSRAF